MTDAFQQGLRLTIHSLQQMKKDGTTHVRLSTDLLKELSSVASTSPVPPAQKAVPSAPRSAAAPVPTKVEPTIPEFELLKQRALTCQLCPHLAATRTHVVFGEGSLSAQLMFVGEAPGIEEDLKGAPFIGRSGQLLTKMIQAMGLSRNQVYIANVVKCRPHLPQGVTGNRPPTEEEVAHCQPYLFSQIDLIKPQVIVALGERASHVLSGYKNDTSAGFRGSWKEFRGIPLMPTFSPSYLLDQDGPSGILEKRKAWEDLLAVMEKLRLPISQKQRSFFLTPS